MSPRFCLTFAVCGAAVLASAQTKAPKPNAQDVPVPTRPSIPGVASSATIPEVLSAEDAVRIAMAQQPALESVRQSVNAADGRTKQLRARLLPQLGVGSTYSSSRFVGDEPRKPALNVPNGYGASASLTQLVFDSNHASDLVRQAKALKLVAQQDLARAKSDLAFQALQGYFLVGEAHRLVTVNERNVSNRDTQLKLAQSKFDSGLGGADDVLTAQTAKGNAVIALVQSRTNEDNAKASLLETLGLDPQTPVRVGDDAAEPLSIERFDEFVAKALEKRPEVLRAKATIDAAKYGARAAKTTTTPTLSSSVNFSTSDPGFPGGGGGYGIGLTLSIPLYDGNLTAGAVQQAQAVLKSAKADLATAQLQVRTEVTQAYYSMSGAEQQQHAADTNVANAKESLRIAEGRYKSGVGLFLDIINAQSALLSAETAAENARAEVSRQRSALRRAAGLLVP